MAAVQPSLTSAKRDALGSLTQTTRPRSRRHLSFTPRLRRSASVTGRRRKCQRSNLLLSQLSLQSAPPLQRLHHDGLPPPLQVDRQQLQGLPVLLRLWARLRRGPRLWAETRDHERNQSRATDPASGVSLRYHGNSPVGVSGRASAARRRRGGELGPRSSDTEEQRREGY